MQTNNANRLTPNLYRVAWWDMTGADYVNCDVYAIDCGGPVVLVDSGRGGPSYAQLKANLQFWGLWDRVALSLLTHMHRDHAGGVLALRADGISIWGGDGHNAYSHNEQALAYWNGEIPPLDKVLSDGARFSLGNVDFQMIKTLGHTSTCVTYLATVDSMRCAFTGDLVMPRGTIGYSGSFDFSSDQLLASLNRLLQLDFDAVLTGHFMQSTQPEGFWLTNGKSHILHTYQNGLDGKWNIQKP